MSYAEQSTGNIAGIVDRCKQYFSIDILAKETSNSYGMDNFTIFRCSDVI
jgi:hypothetical protein